MYKSIIAFAAIAVMSSCDGKREGTFELKGKFTEGHDGEVIYLEKLMNPKPVVVDSTSLDEEGKFEFKNYTPQLGFYRIKTDDRNYAMLVLDSSSRVNVTGNIKDLGNSYKTEGSPETNLFMEYQDLIKAQRYQQDSLNVAFQTIMQSLKMDSLKMDSLSKIFQVPYEAIMEKHCRLVAEKISQNTSMYASLMAISELDPEKYSEVIKALDEGLMKKFPNDKTVRQMHEVISKLVSSLPGQEAPELNLPTPEGENLALSSFRGKIVLVDFWASWCAPCRKEMPNVVNIYKKYKNKGFEIYGVSLDQSKEPWVAAIQTDGMTWPQVSDLKYWNSEAAKLYAVQGIPYTVLLDKEGKIIAKGLRGEELEKAIEKAVSGGSVSQP